MTYDQSCRRLDAFFGGLENTDEEALARSVELQPDAADAALAIMKHVFTPPDGVIREEPSAAPYSALASIVLKHAPAQRQRFVDEVALSIAHPALYRVLAQRIAVAVPAPQLEAALADALRGADEVRCANALDVQEYLYGPTKSLQLSEAGRAAIADAVAALRTRYHLPMRLAHALDVYSLPETA